MLTRVSLLLRSSSKLCRNCDRRAEAEQPGCPSSTWGAGWTSLRLYSRVPLPASSSVLRGKSASELSISHSSFLLHAKWNQLFVSINKTSSSVPSSAPDWSKPRSCQPHRGAQARRLSITLKGIPENSPERLDELQGTCLQGSTLFFILQQQRSRYAVGSARKTKYPTNQPSLGQIPTVELGRTNLFLPSLSERNRSHKWEGGGTTSFLCQPAEGGICTDEHIFSLYEWKRKNTPLVARALVIVLTMKRKNHQGSVCQAPHSPLILLHSWHIWTWLLTQRAEVIMSRLQLNLPQKLGWREQK